MIMLIIYLYKFIYPC